MKKFLIALVALCSLAFTSCFKESEYTITYTDTYTDMANVTVFEYDGDQCVNRQEIKRIQPNTIYEMISSDLADRVVIGVEAIASGRIIEWYSANAFELDPQNPTHITVSFTNMATLDYNPINPDDRVTRYMSN